MIAAAQIRSKAERFVSQSPDWSSQQSMQLVAGR
jgi:hypothetical protein